MERGGIVPTLNAFDMGDTRTTVIIFYGNRVDDIRMQTNVINTLQARMGTGGGNMPLACYPINTMTLGGRPDPVNDARMTLGVGDEGDPQFTISSSHPHAVAAYPIQDGRDMNHQQNGLGISEDGQPSYTLLQTQHASVVVPPSVVRRLTPTECERLQGFPDGWTEGQTDGHRYKQMGNAVAVPVVEWIMERLVEHDRV